MARRFRSESQQTLREGLGSLWSWVDWLLERLVRRRAGLRFELSVTREAVRRGEELEVRVVNAQPGDVGEPLEVGLLCRELWDEERRHGRHTSRVTLDAIAYESWRDADPTTPVQRFAFAVPGAAPYSYGGECLTFVWEVVVREPARLRPDAMRRLEVLVLP